MQWIQPKQDADLVKKFKEEFNINDTLTNILINRGFDIETARTILVNHTDGILSPELLDNCTEAAKIIASYLTDKKAHIFIYADYDTDGITSGYILSDVLNKLGKCDINLYYPERTEGYGISNEFVNKLIESFRDSEERVLVITVDNGISKVEEVAKLKEHGFEVIVTDHHQPKDEVPNCLIVDPFYNNPTDTYKWLAGCGVAFKVAQAVCWEMKSGKADIMEDYLYALAIGTLADVMPLSLENIAVVQLGLQQINSEECPVGIKAFKNFIGKNTLTATDIVWELVPRINACGRMENTSLGSKLFFTENLEYNEEMDDIINAIERTNTERKKLTDKAKKEIEKGNYDNDDVIVIDITEYPEGIAGIVAGRAVETFDKPVIAISGHKDLKVASARCPQGYDLQKILQAEVEKKTIKEFGGHTLAAGLKVHKDNINLLIASLKSNEYVQRNELELLIEDIEDSITVDSQITLRDINEDVFTNINAIPYDSKTVTGPVLLLKDIEVKEFSTSKNNNNNIKFKLKEDKKIIDAWAWGFTNRYTELGKPKHIDILCTIEKDFMNKKNYTIKFIDIREAL